MNDPSAANVPAAKSKESPGKKLDSNWLTAPEGPFYAGMIRDGPEKEALEGKWVNPPLVKGSKN